MLAVLSASKGAQYTPVKIQKLFFLLDRNLGEQIGGPHFNFAPYHYGPFDKEVYQELNKLQLDKLVNLNFGYNNLKQYSLSAEGQKLGETIFSEFSDEHKDYIKKMNSYVLTLSFEQLIKAIYSEYPDTKVNSIFS